MSCFAWIESAFTVLSSRSWRLEVDTWHIDARLVGRWSYRLARRFVVRNKEKGGRWVCPRALLSSLWGLLTSEKSRVECSKRVCACDMWHVNTWPKMSSSSLVDANEVLSPSSCVAVPMHSQCRWPWWKQKRRRGFAMGTGRTEKRVMTWKAHARVRGLPQSLWSCVLGWYWNKQMGSGRR